LEITTMTTQSNTELLNFIDVLAETGSHYRMDEMEALYTDDLAFLVLTPEGGVVRLSRDDMFQEFRERGAAGEPPLSTEKRVLHVEQDGDTAVAVLYRRMGASAYPALYELRLRYSAGRWQVCGETVSPWPDLAKAVGFLPPRQST